MTGIQPAHNAVNNSSTSDSFSGTEHKLSLEKEPNADFSQLLTLNIDGSTNGQLIEKEKPVANNSVKRSGGLNTRQMKKITLRKHHQTGITRKLSVTNSLNQKINNARPTTNSANTESTHAKSRVEVLAEVLLKGLFPTKSNKQNIPSPVEKNKNPQLESAILPPDLNLDSIPGGAEIQIANIPSAQHWKTRPFQTRAPLTDRQPVEKDKEEASSEKGIMQSVLRNQHISKLIRKILNQLKEGAQTNSEQTTHKTQKSDDFELTSQIKNQILQQVDSIIETPIDSTIVAIEQPSPSPTSGSGQTLEQATEAQTDETQTEMQQKEDQKKEIIKKEIIKNEQIKEQTIKNQKKNNRQFLQSSNPR